MPILNHTYTARSGNTTETSFRVDAIEEGAHVGEIIFDIRQEAEGSLDPKQSVFTNLDDAQCTALIRALKDARRAARKGARAAEGGAA